MYHSIRIGNKNTWDDWHLLSTSRPVINPPEPKLTFVEIAGMDGKLDLTDSLSDEVQYNDRVGSWEFYVANDYWPSWIMAYSTILNYLHGKKYKIYLEDEPDYYYVGRLSVNEWKSDPSFSKIVIDYELDPYKYELLTSMDDWLWDPFNFETGVIRTSLYKNFEINQAGNLTITGLRKTVMPYIQVSEAGSSGIMIRVTRSVYNNVEEFTSTEDSGWVQFKNGRSRHKKIKIKMGDNLFEFKGTGKISIDYRGGLL